MPQGSDPADGRLTEAKDASDSDTPRARDRRNILRLLAAGGIGGVATLAGLEAVQRFSGPVNVPGPGLPSYFTESRLAEVRIATAFSTEEHSGSSTDPWPGKAIQSAIDDLPSLGGTVFVPGGFWRIEQPISPRAQLRLLGAGIDATYLFLAPGVNDSLIKDNSAFSTNRLWLCVEQLRLDGGGSSNNAGSGVDLQPQGSGKYWDVVIRNAYVASFAGAGVVTNDCHDYVLDHVAIEANAGDGVAFLGGADGSITNCIIKDNRNGVNALGAIRSRIIGNIIANNAESGILCGTRSMVLGNAVYTNSQGSPDGFDGIQVYLASRCSIMGNDINGGGSQRFGISVVGAQAWLNRVERNQIAGNLSGTISDSGTQTLINGLGREAAGAGVAPTPGIWEVGDTVENTSDSSIWIKDYEGNFVRIA